MKKSFFIFGILFLLITAFLGKIMVFANHFGDDLSFINSNILLTITQETKPDKVVETEEAKNLIDYDFERDGFKETVNGEISYFDGGMDLLLESGEISFIYPEIDFAENAVYEVQISLIDGGTSVSVGFHCDEDGAIGAIAGVVFNLEGQYQILLNTHDGPNVYFDVSKSEFIALDSNTIKIIKNGNFYSFFMNAYLLGEGLIEAGEMGKDVQIMINNMNDAEATFRVENFSVEIIDKLKLPQTTTSIIGIGSEMIREKDAMEMVYVPAGEFLMGSEDGSSDESPIHTVYLDEYWIDTYEVTNQQYALFLNEKGNINEGGVTWLDVGDGDEHIVLNNSTWTVEQGYATHPVIEVSWYGAQAYCEWVGGRLPTEAEWEKAARGTEGQIYPWGNQAPNSNLINFDRNEVGTTPVGKYPEGASPYGALDMVGNVWEWVQDWYASDYYATSPSENPQGPSSGDYRVYRGGFWDFYGSFVRSSNRDYYYPSTTLISLGFRCLLSP